jgi:hypothetical protein
MNTGVRILKYKGPIELHGDFGGIGSSGFKLSIPFQLFGNAAVITLPWLCFNVWKKRIQRFVCENLNT